MNLEKAITREIAYLKSQGAGDRAATKYAHRRAMYPSDFQEPENVKEYQAEHPAPEAPPVEIITRNNPPKR